MGISRWTVSLTNASVSFLSRMPQGVQSLGTTSLVGESLGESPENSLVELLDGLLAGTQGCFIQPVLRCFPQVSERKGGFVDLIKTRK